MSGTAFKSFLARWTARRRRGQSIIELALIVPVLVLILLGIADFARVYYMSMGLHEAVQAGALASLDSRFPDCPAATDYVVQQIEAAPQGVTIQDADIWLAGASYTGGDYGGRPSADADTWRQGNNCWSGGQSFSITVKHDFTFISPYLNIGSNRILTLHSRITGTRNP